MTALKKASVKDIARLAKVSIATVDRALNGRTEINPSTRKRILRIARELSYKPNLAARLLAMGGPGLSIGVCLPDVSDFFWRQVLVGVLEEARRFESLGISILSRLVRRFGTGEVEQVRELLDNDVRAIILAPGDPHGLAPLIEEAAKRRIAVLCVTTDAPGSARSTVISVDPELNGNCAAELMARFARPNSRVAIMTGMLRVEDHRRKVKGFSEKFPVFCPGGRVVEVIEHHDDDAEAFPKSAALLDRFPSIDGIYMSTGLYFSTCQALDAAGLSGKVRLIATDLAPRMVPYFQNGTIYASMYQRPRAQGRTAVHLAVDHLVNGASIPPTRYLNLQIVLRSNLILFPEISDPKLPEPNYLSQHLQLPFTSALEGDNVQGRSEPGPQKKSA
jgi:LacI family transcriptional regulator